MRSRKRGPPAQTDSSSKEMLESKSEQLGPHRASRPRRVCAWKQIQHSSERSQAPLLLRTPLTCVPSLPSFQDPNEKCAPHRRFLTPAPLWEAQDRHRSLSFKISPTTNCWLCRRCTSNKVTERFAHPERVRGRGQTLASTSDRVSGISKKTEQWLLKSDCSRSARPERAAHKTGHGRRQQRERLLHPYCHGKAPEVS